MLPSLSLSSLREGRAEEAKPRVAMISVHGDPLASIGAEEAGGQNVYVREVAKALAGRGVGVDVYTRGRQCDGPEVFSLGAARVIRLPAGPRGFVSRNELFSHLPEFVQNLRAFAGAEGRRYDALHTNYWLSGWVGRALSREWGVAQLHTHHSLGAVKFAATGEAPAAGRARLEVENLLIAECAWIVATSPEDVRSMRLGYRAQPRAAIVPCGVDAENFRPLDKRESREALGLPAQGELLAYVGRFDPAKGIETFVRAAARVAETRPVHLVFAGGYEPGAADGHEFRRIQALVAELGLGCQATFLGKVERSRLPFVYSAADVCVVPSHYESFGMVAIEAMGCGTPVVASDVGGLRFSVAHRETGLLAPARDEAAFAEAIATLLRDEGLRRRLGAAAFQRVGRQFTWKVVAARLEALYAAEASAGGTGDLRRA